MAWEALTALVNLVNQTVTLLTDNGQIPGLRIEAHPGDTVRIRRWTARPLSSLERYGFRETGDF